MMLFDVIVSAGVVEYWRTAHLPALRHLVKEKIFNTFLIAPTGHCTTAQDEILGNRLMRISLDLTKTAS
jgi:hypothetical protein